MTQAQRRAHKLQIAHRRLSGEAFTAELRIAQWKPTDTDHRRRIERAAENRFGQYSFSKRRGRDVAMHQAAVEKLRDDFYASPFGRLTRLRNAAVGALAAR